MGPPCGTCVTFQVLHPEKRKSSQVYHVNLLKEWRETTADKDTVLFACKGATDGDEGEDKMEDVAGQRSPAKIILKHLKEEQREQLLQIVDKQPNLFRTEPERTKLIEHIIQLTDPSPIRQQPYRVPERLSREIQLIKDMGVIEPSTSPWSSPTVLVPKKDGSLRICLDFWKLNVVSRFDAYPMPQIYELVERIGQAKYITTLDLCKGCW